MDREAYTCTYLPSPSEDVSLVGICRIKIIDVRKGVFSIFKMFLHEVTKIFVTSARSEGSENTLKFLT